MVKKELYPKYSTQQKKANKRRYEKRRVDAIKHYGEQCYCCREEHLEFLLVCDNEGRSYNFDTLSGAMWPKRFKVLCRNCSHAMRFHEECPHQAPLSDY